MNKLTEAYVTDYIPTIYSTPCTVEYTQDGKKFQTDLLFERDSVVIIVYNITRDVLIFVKQFRPAAYVSNIPQNERQSQIDISKHTAENSIALEWCAGLVDKNISIEKIAQEEVLEECGYNVPLNGLQLICTFPNGSFTTGARQTLFYCEVTDDMKVSAGGGIDDEIIEVVEVTVPQMLKYIESGDMCSPSNVMFGFYWFLENKCNH